MRFFWRQWAAAIYNPPQPDGDERPSPVHHLALT